MFDRGPLAGGTAFNTPCAVIRADGPAEIDRAFDEMQRAQAGGKWLAGYLSYEFGYLASPKLAPLLPRQRALPLVHFGVFDRPEHARAPETTAPETTAPVAFEPAQPLWDFEQYQTAFQIVHDYIEAGDVYQVNLTFPILSRFAGAADALYARLCQRQPVPHGALVDLEGVLLLSRSPELFFSLTATGELTTRPMKGTAPRGDTAAKDDALRDALHLSAKNRAENLMIVDLLRNDMSRISELGSVMVPELFAVHRFATLHQMTSTVTSQVRRGTSLKEMFEALFPCGSITGAPKVRAMQIIRDLEAGPRAAYCGSIGWIAPDGAMEFNVAIRTLQIGADNSVRMHVGGGVVYDSTPQDEYAEALLKAKFAKRI